jgi:hypothetical protein
MPLKKIRRSGSLEIRITPWIYGNINIFSDPPGQRLSIAKGSLARIRSGSPQPDAVQQITAVIQQQCLDPYLSIRLESGIGAHARNRGIRLASING